MSKILITGNGFDLNYGLPTSYSDFINILNKIESNQKQDYNLIFSQFAENKLLAKNFKPFELDAQKIKLLESNMKDSQWYDFFKSEFHIESWIDFENKIEYVLKILFSSAEYLKTNIFANGSIESIIEYYPDLFNNNAEIIYVLNKFDIISLKENGNIFLNEKYLIKKYGFFINIDIDKITKFLLNELVIFKKIFNYYFEIFVYPMYDNLKVELDKNQFFSIDKHYTFNYTPSFERFFNSNLTTSFLHGNINSELNKIVLGINEIPNTTLEKRYFLPFTKYFQKLNNKSDYLFLKEIEDRQKYNHMFFFVGHSLNKSDEDYINEVFDFVNQSHAKSKNIVIAYHTEKSRSQLLINLLIIRGKKDIERLMKDEILLFELIDSPEFKKLLNKNIKDTPMSIGVF
ncbi:AbiH family protein [Psychroserpens sp. AS72]|uniref:AbiH family protein n=1 Tax=Psychroserpens sp. AS72 TaxID=3135775 RepID=UPI00316F0718